MLKAEYRLKKRKDFAYIYRRGKSFAASNIAMNYIKVKSDELLIGFSASKKVGNAVSRNHVKRIMRECVRKNISVIPIGYRIIFNARAKSSSASFAEISNDIYYLIGKLNHADTTNKGL